MGFIINNLYQRLEELYWTIVPYNYRPLQLWYRLKCRLFKRYNTVKCRYLPYTWNDRDEVLVHVMFEVLSEFIEQECTHTDPSSHDYQKLICLYHWWHTTYNKERIDNIRKLENESQKCMPTISSGTGLSSKMFSFKSEEDEEQWNTVLQELNWLDQYYEKELNDKLCELVSLRKYLWS